MVAAEATEKIELEYNDKKKRIETHKQKTGVLARRAKRRVEAWL